MYLLRKSYLMLAAAVALTALVAAPAAAQCPQFLCYVDLDFDNGLAICPSAVYEEVLFKDGAATTCTDGTFQAAVVQVDVPAGCTGVSVWLEYQGIPQGWTLNIGDSESNNGFGGDAGTLPVGQNAEVEVLDELVRVWSAADNPSDVDPLATQHLALNDGALKFVVQNQYVSWGQQYTALETPDLERLFFLPDLEEVPEGNRTIWVGLNRTISDTGRKGCGARRALIHVQ